MARRRGWTRCDDNSKSMREELRVQTMRMAQFYAPLWFAILCAKPNPCPTGSLGLLAWFACWLVGWLVLLGS